MSGIKQVNVVSQVLGRGWQAELSCLLVSRTAHGRHGKLHIQRHSP